MNFFQIFSDVVQIEGAVTADEGQLLAGQDVTVPAKITVGSVQGHPIYLHATLSLLPPSSAPAP